MRVRTLVAILLWVVIAIALVGTVAMSTWETPRSRYAVAQAAEEDGAFERGWLPEVLRNGTTDIREEHDIDTNHGRATFRYSSAFATAVEGTCTRWPAHARVVTPYRSWPDFLWPDDTPERLAIRRVAVFKCGDFTIATDTVSKAGYMWH